MRPQKISTPRATQVHTDEGDEDAELRASLRILLPNDVDALQPEERGCGEEVAVIGIDLSEAVFGGTGEVEGVRSAEVGGLGHGRETRDHAVQKGVAQAQPVNAARGEVRLKLRDQRGEAIRAGAAFSP